MAAIPNLPLKLPVDILSTSDARKSLPSLLKLFRKKRSKASPVLVGAHRKPEAVLMSYDSFRAILDYLDELAIVEQIAERDKDPAYLSEDKFFEKIGRSTQAHR